MTRKTENSSLRACNEWPEQWMGSDEDVPYGQGIVEAMKPFIESLIAGPLTDRTLRKHLGNLWLLGGEVIRSVSVHDEYTTVAPYDKLLESIGPGEGPDCRHLYYDAERRSFDSTCGMLHRFLARTKNGPPQPR
ncbi:MAG: hypothetical protein WCK77_15140 [Verrucomicrobiota bacterium]